jgi:phosphoribosylformimino-5-aminoimidazole carboxamide ribotide isomerase
MIVMPAIDIRGGRCVRLVQGDFSRETTYGDDPAEQASRFEGEGARWIHVVDLDGALQGAPINLHVVQAVRSAVRCSLQFGGGIRSLETAERVLAAGADRVVLGTRLLSEGARELLKALGDRAVAGLDARHRMVAVRGWTESSPEDLVEFARKTAELGARRLAVTDVGRDGTMEGPNLALVAEVLDAVSVPVIASGGVGSLEDLRALRVLGDRGLEAVIVGRALYEGRFTLAEAVEALSA